MAQMSDGERSAVIIAANVITAKSGTVFLIDEPERHLHRSIIEPLLSTLFTQRPDCPFIISTHEMELPIGDPETRVLMVRSCEWSGNRPSAWDIKILNEGLDLPDDLKRSILGSRKRILFVEGQSQSRDKPLYEALFPEISVVAKGSCNDVINAVKGLRNSASHHHVEAFGLIDKDYRNAPEIVQLANENVFALDVYSAESIYYCSDAIDAIARRQAESFGLDAEEISKLARRKALDVINGDPTLPERMAARRSERIVRDRCQQQMPNSQSIRENADSQIILSIDSPYAEELVRFKELVSNKDLDGIIASYPIRESGVIGAIASALDLRSWHYERMLPVLIKNDASFAEKLKQRIRSLADALAR